jgi:diacylglycerol kinase
VSPEYNSKAGIVKDVAAGAVLVTSLIAAIIGLLIFGRKILQLLAYTF